jgi:hypothetical protein
MACVGRNPSDVLADRLRTSSLIHHGFQRHLESRVPNVSLEQVCESLVVCWNFDRPARGWEEWSIIFDGFLNRQTKIHSGFPP